MFFLKQNIHISAHFHILEPVTVSFSAMCMVYQEETAGTMPNFGYAWQFHFQASLYTYHTPPTP